MFAILHVLWIFVVDIFKSRRRLEAENLFLHHQLNIALRRAPPRLRLYGSDRALLVWMTRIWPGLLDISRVVKPETILRWHRYQTVGLLDAVAHPCDRRCCARLGWTASSLRADMIFGKDTFRIVGAVRLQIATDFLLLAIFLAHLVGRVGYQERDK
jgi:hypothetical protein